MSNHISRHSTLTEAQYDGLRRIFSDGWTRPALVIQANTLYALEKKGFIERDPGLRDRVASEIAWRRRRNAFQSASSNRSRCTTTATSPSL